MITWANVVGIDPGLAAVPTGTQTAILADVYETLDATRWGAKLDQGATYLAAHTARLNPSAAGAVQSERLGDAATAYAVPVAMAVFDLDATAWGKRFQLLVRGLGTYMVVV